MAETRPDVLSQTLTAIAAIERDVAAGKLTKDEGERAIAAYGPQRVDDGNHKVKLDGMFLYGELATDGVQKIKLLFMPGTPQTYVAVFSTVEKLKAFCTEYNQPYTAIKTVTEGLTFLDECTIAGVKIIVDPYRHENGRTRWIECEGLEDAS